MTELTPNQIKWVEALESGEYKQGRDVLHDIANDAWCCLGVACDLAIKDGVEMERTATAGVRPFESFNGYFYGLPKEVMRWLGVDGPSDTVRIGKSDAITLNDDDGLSFKEIAHQIRRFGVRAVDGNTY